MPSAPIFVAPVLPIELFFFQRVFRRLVEQRRERERVAEAEDEQVAAVLQPLRPITPEGLEEEHIAISEFQRAMVRLFRFLDDGRLFDAKAFDTNDDGRVGWYEFCSLIP